MDRMGVQPILPVKVSVTIDIMLNFDDEFDRYGNGNVTCKQIFSVHCRKSEVAFGRGWP